MTLVLSDEDVAKLMPMADCIEAMEVAFRDHALGGAVNIPRIRYISPTTSPDAVYVSNVHIGTTPSYDTAAIRIGGNTRGTDPAMRVGPAAGPGSRNWGFICLIDMQTGAPLAFIQEFYLSGIRVGATSGVAAKHLAPPDAQTVCMFGSGKLARTDLEALVQVRPVRSVRVFSPTKEHREEFSREMGRQLEIDVTPVDGPREAMQGADIICCATNAGYVSGLPVFDGDWLDGRGSSSSPCRIATPTSRSRRSTRRRSPAAASSASTTGRACTPTVSASCSTRSKQAWSSWDRICTLGEVAAGTTPLEAKPGDIVYYKNSHRHGDPDVGRPAPSSTARPARWASATRFRPSGSAATSQPGTSAASTRPRRGGRQRWRPSPQERRRLWRIRCHSYPADPGSTSKHSSNSSNTSPNPWKSSSVPFSQSQRQSPGLLMFVHRPFFTNNFERSSSHYRMCISNVDERLVVLLYPFQRGFTKYVLDPILHGVTGLERHASLKEVPPVFTRPSRVTVE